MGKRSPAAAGLSVRSPLPAVAGTLYRCVGPDGVPNYASKRVGRCQSARWWRQLQRPAAFPGACQTVPAGRQPLPSPAPPPRRPRQPAPVRPGGPADRQQVVPVPRRPAATLPAGQAGAGATVPRGAVYQYRSDGVRHYTNVQPARRGAVPSCSSATSRPATPAALLPGVNFGTLRLNTVAYQAEIARRRARSSGSTRPSCGRSSMPNRRSTRMRCRMSARRA